jgi:hypothetical protein
MAGFLHFAHSDFTTFVTMKRLLLLLLLPSAACIAQSEPMAKNAFLHRDITEAFDYWNIQRPNTTFHSSFRPYLSSTFADATDSVLPFRSYGFRNFFLANTLNEKPENRNWFSVQAHPVADVEAGYDMLLRKAVSSTAGGMHLKLNVNNDFTFASTLVGGNCQLPFFLDTGLRSARLLPAYGQAYKSNNRGFNFFDFTGYVSYSPNNNKVFNLQAGRDRHFIGDGYRSVLLSDFAPAYPFLRINTSIWRIQYNVWYTWMNDISKAHGVKSGFTNKFGTFHYLSYNILKELNIGVFENVVWRGTDTNQVRNFEVNYLNPVVFYRPQEYSVGSPDNSFIGLNLNATIARRFKLYAQLGLDEFYLREIRARSGWWANKQAWQLGAKYINAFGIKGLKLQAEYNQVRPYTYSHGLPDQNYGHYGMPLAHPLGANFKEYLGFVTYRKDRWQFSAQGMYVLAGEDSARAGSNYGKNIFKSYTTRAHEYGNKTGQGVPHTILQSDLRVTYYVIPALHARLEAGYIQRSEQLSESYFLENPYFYLSFKTSFWNNYRDF